MFAKDTNLILLHSKLILCIRQTDILRTSLNATHAKQGKYNCFHCLPRRSEKVCYIQLKRVFDLLIDSKTKSMRYVNNQIYKMLYAFSLLVFNAVCYC